MNTKAKRVLFIIFTLVCMVLVGFAVDSYAKYIFSSSEIIEGHYTDFRLTHDGANKSVILEEVSDTKYTHEGFVTINLQNCDSKGDPSQRDILFNFVAVTLEQIAAEEVVDSWGESTPLLKDTRNNGYFSDYYDLTVVDASGTALGTADTNGKPQSGSKLYTQNFLKAEPNDPNAPAKSTSVIIKIQRRKIKRSSDTKDEASLTNSDYVPDLSTNSVESLDLILKTFVPYIDLRVLQLNLTSSLIYVSTFEETFSNTDKLVVNTKTSINYSVKITEDTKDQDDGDEQETNTYSSSLPVKLVFNFDSTELLFDYEKFRLSVEGNYQDLSELVNDGSNGKPVVTKESVLNSYKIGYYYENNLTGTDTLTLFVPAASNIDLEFYVRKNSGCDISLSAATFKLSSKLNDGTTDTYNYLSEVSGITSTETPRLIYSN